MSQIMKNYFIRDIFCVKIETENRKLKGTKYGIKRKQQKESGFYHITGVK